MNQFNFEEWNRIRKKGRFVYVLTHWILSAALPAAIICPFLKAFFGRKSLSYYISPHFIKILVLSMALCFIIAIFFGLKAWEKHEKLFKQTIEAKLPLG